MVEMGRKLVETSGCFLELAVEVTIVGGLELACLGTLVVEVIGLNVAVDVVVDVTSGKLVAVEVEYGSVAGALLVVLLLGLLMELVWAGAGDFVVVVDVLNIEILVVSIGAIVVVLLVEL